MLRLARLDRRRSRAPAALAWAPKPAGRAPVDRWADLRADWFKSRARSRLAPSHADSARRLRPRLRSHCGRASCVASSERAPTRLDPSGLERIGSDRRRADPSGSDRIRSHPIQFAPIGSARRRLTTQVVFGARSLTSAVVVWRRLAAAAAGSAAGAATKAARRQARRPAPKPSAASKGFKVAGDSRGLRSIVAAGRVGLRRMLGARKRASTRSAPVS